MSLPVIEVPRRRPWPPRVTAATRPFWEALAAGRLTTLRCNACGRLTFPPKPVCPHCWGEDMAWVALSGRGRLYSQTVIHAAPAAFLQEAPFRNGIVDLDEGLRVAARLVGDGPLPLDGPVEAVILRYEDGPLFGFRAVA